MSDIIRLEDRYYILASSSLADDRTRVLKHGRTFAVFDRFGDVQPIGLQEQGLYRGGTRFLSALSLSIEGRRPLLLGSTVRRDNLLLAVDLTNPDVLSGGRLHVPRGALHVLRSKVLWQSACHERIRVTNYSLAELEVGLSLSFEADFADVFEVRGVRRPRRGAVLEPRLARDGATLAYRGLDGVVRRTVVRCTPEPDEVTSSSVSFRVRLPPRSDAAVAVTVTCEVGAENGETIPYDAALARAVHELEQGRRAACRVSTSNDQFNDWLDRSLADVQMMMTETATGPYPFAGVPWFCTTFGRDGIISALELLWLDPRVARGVLTCLAASQATTEEAGRDAQPGKILHEAREGEMAALGEIPFGRYYGTADATPLFVLLAGAYYARTGDLELITALRANVDQALEWIESYADCDGDGFFEYLRRSHDGLANQGWKDSGDSIFHADGSLAEGPIALCEVQGYVYAAWRAAALLCGALGDGSRAAAWQSKARALRVRFEATFWCEELGTYALALDGEKRPCRVRSSNAGHCLFAGIAAPSRARRTAETLMSSEMFSGWGVRTVGAGELRYDPMSYHNGSVWPHDNALIAAGLARYGLMEQAGRILSGVFDASRFTDQQRLPELYCGFERRPSEGPTLYPVACRPQTWAAASAFALLQACLGLSVDARRGRVCFASPALPPFLEEVSIERLRVGAGEVDLLVRRDPVAGVAVSVAARRGAPVGVVVLDEQRSARSRTRRAI